MTQLDPIAPRPHFTIPSILAVVSAILSFRSGAIFGFVCAVLAIVLGVFGILLALLPNKRGGIISFFSIVAGAIGIIAAIFKLVGHVV